MIALRFASSNPSQLHGRPGIRPARRHRADEPKQGDTILAMNSQRAHDRAEASFKKKEAQHLEGQRATAEYSADRLAVREKTARLKALRLARDAAAASQ